MKCKDKVRVINEKVNPEEEVKNKNIKILI